MATNGSYAAKFIHGIYLARYTLHGREAQMAGLSIHASHAIMHLDILDTVIVFGGFPLLFPPPGWALA